MVQPIVIDSPVLHKLRGRLGVRSGLGRNAELSLIVVPTVDIDPLLRKTVADDAVIVPSAVTFYQLFSVPTTKFYRLKRVWTEDLALSDYSYQVVVRVHQLGTDAGNIVVPVTPYIVAAGVADNGSISLEGITLQPGNNIGINVDAWTAGGSGTRISVLLEEVDCAP